MTSYRVLATDLLTNTIREELQVKDLVYSEALNAPGAMSGWVSLDDPKTTRTNLDPGATAIYIERGGLLVWGGILWTARADTTSRRLDLGGEGFWSYFRRRIIRATQTYAAEDQLVIARDLIDYAQAQPGGDIGITVGTETSGVTRDRIYWHYERKNIGEAVEQLAAVLGGFDFAINVAWDTDGVTPLKTFTLYYPRRGSRDDQLVFNHNVAGIASFEVPVDATKAANLVDILGQGEGDDMLIASAADTSLLTRYPLLEETLAYKDVSSTDTLNAHAAAQVWRRKLPFEIPAISTQASIWPDFGSFQVGDEGFVVADDGWVSISSYQRIQEREITVGDEGQELMKIGFVSADVSVD